MSLPQARFLQDRRVLFVLLMASALVVAAAFQFVRPAMAQTDSTDRAGANLIGSYEYRCFLALDGIDGESTDQGHKNEIDIQSFSWGATNVGTHGSGGGGGAGKVRFQDFHFTKTVDKSSPLLFLANASGQHIKKAVLACRKAGGGQQEFYKATLSDLLVSSYDVGSQTSQIGDSFSLNFGKIEFEYRPQKADGSLGEAVKAGWDVKANKGV